jgi:hypothetical protein
MQTLTVVVTEDEHECETCGSSYIQGVQIFDKKNCIWGEEAFISCTACSNYDHPDPKDVKDILESIGFNVEVINKTNETM